MSKRKGNQRETEFIGLSPEEVQRLLDDPTTSKADKRRLARHQKAEGLRNKRKRRK